MTFSLKVSGHMQRTHPSQVLSRNIVGDSSVFGPVLQFSLLIVPLVMNCFYMVYSLAGWIITDRDKLNWSLEAPTVGIWVFGGMFIFCALVLAITRLRGGGWWHPLSVSSMAHIGLAALLTISIWVTVKL